MKKLKRLNKKGDWKTLIVVGMTFVGLVLLFIAIYRLIFKGGILG